MPLESALLNVSASTSQSINGGRSDLAHRDTEKKESFKDVFAKNDGPSQTRRGKPREENSNPPKNVKEVSPQESQKTHVQSRVTQANTSRDELAGTTQNTNSAVANNVDSHINSNVLTVGPGAVLQPFSVADGSFSSGNVHGMINRVAGDATNSIVNNTVDGLAIDEPLVGFSPSSEPIDGLLTKRLDTTNSMPASAFDTDASLSNEFLLVEQDLANNYSPNALLSTQSSAMLFDSARVNMRDAGMHNKALLGESAALQANKLGQPITAQTDGLLSATDINNALAGVTSVAKLEDGATAKVNFFETMQQAQIQRASLSDAALANLKLEGSQIEGLKTDQALADGENTRSSSLSTGLLGAQGADGKLSIPVTVKFGTAQWNTFIAERATQMAMKNIQFAEMTLNPDDLGPVQVKVTVNQDQAHVVFNTANMQVKEALDQSIIRLREMMAQEGLDLVEAQVHDDSQFAQEQQENQSGSDTRANLRDADELSDSEGEVISQQTLSVDIDNPHIDSYV